MKRDNPFTLTFGKEPGRAIMRLSDMNDMMETFQADDPVSQTFLIEGIRGSGKTVLMTMVSNRLKADDRWMIINLNPALDLLTGFAARLRDACTKKQNLTARGFGLSAAGFGISLEGKQNDQDSITSIEKSLAAIKKEGKRVLITIDEVTHNENMRIFASQFQIFVREEHPVFLIMTGLFENIHAIQNDPVLTFLLRSPKITTTPLSILQITRQYEEIFKTTEEQARKLAEITKGYAFAFQALGSVCWTYGTDQRKLVLEKLDEMLDDFVYKKIWVSLPVREKEIVLAIDHDNVKTREICERIGMNPSAFSKYKNRLTDKGIMSSCNHGYNCLALPRFYEIVRLYDLEWEP